MLDFFAPKIEESDILKRLNVKPFEYFLVTLHRAENVDIPERLINVFKAFSEISDKFGKEVLVSVHPRTAEKINQFGIAPASTKVRLLDAFGFIDFVKLEKNSLAVMTDSGTVQEECSIFGVPNVTLRDVTERPETIECGSNILSGAEPDAIIRAVELAIAQPASWTAPKEYLTENVSQIVSKILLGYTSLRTHH